MIVQSLIMGVLLFNPWLPFQHLVIFHWGHAGCGRELASRFWFLKMPLNQLRWVHRSLLLRYTVGCGEACLDWSLASHAKPSWIDLVGKRLKMHQASCLSRISSNHDTWIDFGREQCNGLASWLLHSCFVTVPLFFLQFKRAYWPSYTKRAYWPSYKGRATGPAILDSEC